MVDLDKLSLSELNMLKYLVDSEKRRIINMAKERNIFGKIIDIVTTMGVQFHKNHGSYWVYIEPETLMSNVKSMDDVMKLINSTQLVIIFDDYGRNADVYYRGKKVFYIHLGEVEKVSAGEWMDMIDKLYNKAIKISRERERKALLDEIVKEAEEWGIDLENLVNRVKQAVLNK